MAWARRPDRLARARRRAALRFCLSALDQSAYDPIGNRESATAYDSPTRTTDYNPNELNQYENAMTEVSPKLIPQGFRYDADGNLSEMFVVGDANCDGAVNNGDVDCFVAAASGNYTAYVAAGGSAACWAERHDWGDFDGDGQCTNLDIDPFVDLLGANGSGAVIALRFEWDGENRLTRVTYPDDCSSGMPNGFQRVSFKYDYLGRRIEKKVETCSASGGTWSTAARRLYVYDQWNLLLELDATTSGSPVLRKYTWGLDLAGQSGEASAAGLHGAGGIGGLLAVDVQTADPDTAETGGFWFCFDANGNVMQLVAEANGYGGATGDEWHADRLKARYEYDPYGNLANTPSAFGMTNPYRFSTKYWVDQFGMGDWGYRWYDPRVGRWISRDPIGELGGLNIMRFLTNTPTTKFDSHGKSDVGNLAGVVCGGAQAIGLPSRSLPPNCSDCWITCISTAGQALGGGDDGWVICRPDGCRCACVSQITYPPGGDYVAEARRECALAHEEAHVRQESDWCVFCPSSSGLVRQQSRTICGNQPECDAYQVELSCLGKKLGLCGDDDRCKRALLSAIASVLANACNSLGCMDIAPPREVLDMYGVLIYNRLVRTGCGRRGITGDDWVPPGLAHRR